ncbi:MAG: hypothetical protein IPH10_09270 [bacterium]|nr:hypothetical protein [bacterium]
MSAKLCPKIILEGTRLTSKTELGFLLNEHPKLIGPRKYRYHSPYVSGEWCAFSNFPWGRGLINFELEEEQRAFETYHTWIKLFELLRYYSWIVDRFHLSTQMHQHLYCGRDYDFRWLEERLAAVGFRIVLCMRQPATFVAARAERLEVSGNPSQYDDLTRFIREQEYLEALADRSAMRVLKLDVSGGDLPALADKIYNWYEQTGGLYAEY